MAREDDYISNYLLNKYTVTLFDGRANSFNLTITSVSTSEIMMITGATLTKGNGSVSEEAEEDELEACPQNFLLDGI